MALRSGYYGLKKSAITALQTLLNNVSGMKIIKSFGDGLKLSNAGKLSLEAATDTKMGGFKVGSGLSMEDGVLSATATGAGEWTALEEQPTTGTTEITFPSGFEASEIMLVGKCDLGTYKVAATMVVNMDSLESGVYYYDFGAASVDAFFLRYGITNASIQLNTAKANNQSVASSVSTMVYYR